MLSTAPGVMRGWPYRPATPLVRPYYADPPTRGQLGSSLSAPAAGPDSTLYLPLQARGEAVGGSLVAVGPDGRERFGWPVELTEARRGSSGLSSLVQTGPPMRWRSQPETGGASSATILAIAPDSTVRYTTTIVDP